MSPVLEPVGEVGANFSLKILSQIHSAKMKIKKVIAKNQCEKHNISSLSKHMLWVLKTKILCYDCWVRKQ